MPASRFLCRKPVINAIAQPCEKPASTMRWAGMPRCFFALQQLLDLARASGAGRLVLALDQVHAQDVVPGAHPVAVVDGHRDHRRVRKDETHGADRGQVEFLRDGHEIVAVGAQAVQHDDRGAGLRPGFGFDGFKLCHL